ncbi:MAG: hypothetical protein QOJ07_1008 [Thermoleophilaceae bacterium]|nr:hypothetical protein [Thermoleophilaceae bacterium]
MRPAGSRALGAVCLLIAAGSAVALPGDRPQRGPAPLLAGTSSPLVHANSRAGEAILTASDVKPGDTRTGEVEIANRGGAGGVHLILRDPVDRPGARGAPLSRRLRLTVTDATAGHVVEAGPLTATRRCIRLGDFEPGEARRYRFAVAWPDGGPGGADNAYAGASARLDLEWVQSAADECSGLPVAAPALELGDMTLRVAPGPYRFTGRTGTASVAIRCIATKQPACAGRLELERRTSGQGRGLAMAVGRFAIDAGTTRRVTLRLNGRARRRVAGKRVVPVRAYVVARDASGRRHRAAYRDRLVYRP